VSTVTHSETPTLDTGPRHLVLPRLVRLHLASRRIPTAIAALCVLIPLMQWAVRGALSQGSTGGPGPAVAARQLALLLETAAAAVVSAAMHGPFGESEKISGRLLPWLRLMTASLLTGVALTALSLGAWGTGLPGGEFAVLRDTAGMVGIGLLGTVVIGGHFAWTGPAGYFVIAAYADSDTWTTPWTWPARPGDDLGAAMCATSIAMLAILAITVLGPRQHTRE
jgi:hypothetical protein